MARSWTWVALAVLAGSSLARAGEPALTAKARSALVESVAKALTEEYIFPDKAAAMSRRIRARLKSGGYDRLASLAELVRALNADLEAAGKDRHIHLWITSPEEKRHQEEDEAEEMRATNHGFRRLEILPGNVGYLDLRIFDSPKRADRTVDAAMALFADVDALIIDLRNNGGGDGYTVLHLLSYLYANNPVHHLDSRYRDHVDQFWTESSVPGPDLGRVPLWVLTSNGTFSAAEDFAYGLKTRKRATIVGETTRGGAHPVTFRYFPDPGVELMIPNAESVSPLTGGNWEGTGVVPDIEVPEIRSLSTAYVAALTTLVGKQKNPPRKRRLEWILEGARAEANLVVPRAEDLRPLAGRYGEWRIAFDGGHLYWVRDARSRYRLIPIGPDLFRLESGPRLAFVRDPEGQVRALVRSTPDGSRQTSPRTQP